MNNIPLPPGLITKVQAFDQEIAAINRRKADFLNGWLFSVPAIPGVSMDLASDYSALIITPIPQPQPTQEPDDA